MNFGIKTLATIETFNVMTDASGAPAVISYGGYAFAFDVLGEIKCNLIRPMYGSRLESKIALDICTAAYRACLKLKTIREGWLDANRAMYAPAAH